MLYFIEGTAECSEHPTKVIVMKVAVRMGMKKRIR